jgi:hypothetical protein
MYVRRCTLRYVCSGSSDANRRNRVYTKLRGVITELQTKIYGTINEFAAEIEVILSEVLDANTSFDTIAIKAILARKDSNLPATVCAPTIWHAH